MSYGFGGSPFLPLYYDRNPVKRSLSQATNPGAAARASTKNASYTVPAGKKAIADAVRVSCENASATALTGRAGSWCEITPSGGTARNILEALLTIGDPARYFSPGAANLGELEAGDEIALWDFSANTAPGSDVRNGAAAVITEFDK